MLRLRVLGERQWEGSDKLKGLFSLVLWLRHGKYRLVRLQLYEINDAVLIAGDG
jgi:hypothetical protein